MKPHFCHKISSLCAGRRLSTAKSGLCGIVTGSCLLRPIGMLDALHVAGQKAGPPIPFKAEHAQASSTLSKWGSSPPRRARELSLVPVGPTIGHILDVRYLVRSGVINAVTRYSHPEQLVHTLYRETIPPLAYLGMAVKKAQNAAIAMVDGHRARPASRMGAASDDFRRHILCGRDNPHHRNTKKGLILATRLFSR